MRPATLLLTAALAATPGTRAADPPKPDPVPLDFTGHAEAATVEVRARVPGYLARQLVKEGATVKKGDLLAEIDPRPYQLQLDAARGRLKAAEAKVQLARVAVARAKAAFAAKAVGRDDLDQATAAADEAAGLLEAARAEAATAELNLGYTKLAAPFAGRVGRFQAAEGALLLGDDTRVITVVAPDPLFVWFEMDERTLFQLRRSRALDGDKVTVGVGFTGEDGYPNTGRLDLVEPQVDPKTGTVRLRATVPNPNGLYFPGMFARVRLNPAPAK